MNLLIYLHDFAFMKIYTEGGQTLMSVLYNPFKHQTSFVMMYVLLYLCVRVGNRTWLLFTYVVLLLCFFKSMIFKKTVVIFKYDKTICLLLLING